MAKKTTGISRTTASPSTFSEIQSSANKSHVAACTANKTPVAILTQLLFCEVFDNKTMPPLIKINTHKKHDIVNVMSTTVRMSPSASEPGPTTMKSRQGAKHRSILHISNTMKSPSPYEWLASVGQLLQEGRQLYHCCIDIESSQL